MYNERKIFMPRFITTLDYLRNHDIDSFKNQEIKIVTSEPNLPIELVTQLFQRNIRAEFEISEPDNVDFTLGYLFGRTVSSNTPTTILTDRPLTMPKLMHSDRGVIVNDISDCVFDNKVNSSKKKGIESTEAGEYNGADNVATVDNQPSKSSRKTKKANPSSDMSSEIASTIQQFTDSIATPEETGAANDFMNAPVEAINVPGDPEFVIPDSLDKKLEDLKIYDQLSSVNYPKNKFLIGLVKSLKCSYEPVSFEIQLQINVTYEVTQLVYPKLKKVFDELKDYAAQINDSVLA